MDQSPQSGNDLSAETRAPVADEGHQDWREESERASGMSVAAGRASGVTGRSRGLTLQQERAGDGYPLSGHGPPQVTEVLSSEEQLLRGANLKASRNP